MANEKKLLQTITKKQVKSYEEQQKFAKGEKDILLVY